MRALLMLLVLTASGRAWAEEAVPSPVPVEPVVEEDIPEGDARFLTPEMLASELVEVWGERQNKPFDRDTELRLTGKELAERGATDLADALDLIPELNVRAAGRGGRQIDIRGARKGSVRVMIDGLPISDPFYGNIDISSIPITDVEQIRVSSTPASPIDGTGGPGGVIEVHTRDAVGSRLVLTQLRGNSLPSGSISVTARDHLDKHTAIRGSLSGDLSFRQFEVLPPEMEALALDEDRERFVAAARVERRRPGGHRLALDLWGQHQSYLTPPSEDGSSEYLFIDGEEQGRVGLSYDSAPGRWRVQARGYYQYLQRASSYYRDESMSEPSRSEDVVAHRQGASLLVNRAIGHSLDAITALNLERDQARVQGFDDTELGGSVSVMQGAGGLMMHKEQVSLSSAVGVAVPVGIGASPWPEGKLSGTWRAADALELQLTLARKGRVPTLRERFRLDIGNSELGPEQADVGELAVTLRPAKKLQLRTAAYVRKSNGMIRFDADQRQLINTDELVVRGVEARVQKKDIRLGASRRLDLGGLYTFTDAYSERLGTDPLDFLPRHKAELWAQLRLASSTGITGRLRHLSEQIDRGTTLEARTFIDLSAFAELHRNLFLSARVDNLLGTPYYMRSNVLAPGRVLSVSLQNRFF